MLKRKILAGGYQDSSDDEKNLDADLRRQKLTPYAPPRLTAASRSVSGAFQLPGSSGPLSRVSTPRRHVSVSSSSSRPTPVPESVQSAHNTPEIQIARAPFPVSRGATVEPSSAAAATVPVKPSFEQSGGYKPNNTRPSLALERQMNELTEVLEEYKHASEEQHKATDSTLTRILDTVSRLEFIKSNPSLTPEASSPLLLTHSNLSDTKPFLSNPKPSLELVSIVSKVVSEARSRVGKKKGGADDNSCKEHARTTFYRMLGIAAAREVRPYFEDEYGEPDTLPSQFIDPETRYCQPYPHWKTPLTKQIAWIPTYILRFRTTIPNDRSELSNVLRNLSDEAIVILLNDGPFKSATAAWRDAKKSDVEIEAMRSNARRYQRCDKKAAVRASYIKTIPSLQGSEWEYLSHPGYVSQDESDNEGTLFTRRPEHRATWESNLYDAILVAEREKARARPGICPRLPRRSVDIVKRPIPQLERGTGSAKVAVRVAVCGISKTWRQNHSDEFRKYAHLINMKHTAKPDIAAFLEQHPISDLHGDADDDKSEGGVVKLEGGWPSGEGADFSTGEASWTGLDYDGDEESGAILEMGDDSLGYSAMGLVGKPEVPELAEGSDHGDTADIPIDPQLIVEDARDNSNQPGSGHSDELHTLPRPDLTSAGGLPTRLDHNIPLPPVGSKMPPPPLLALNPNPAASQGAANNAASAESKLKKPRSSKVGSVAVNADDNEEGEGLSSGTTVPKRRGRPPGSKNRKSKV